MSSQSNLTAVDRKMLERAIKISRLGLSNVAPNPHVGAVIAVGDLIIGEGFHRKCGGPHAEVNAFNSVSKANEKLLEQATIYVTLEPCSHYGKTPPCSLLIIEKGVKRVVVGAVDPNPKVDGGGIEMMCRASINVIVADGEIAQRCRELDPVFMTSFSLKRPFVTLKWAQSNDGYMADKEGHPVKFSTPLTSTIVHQLRSCHQAILTTSSTV
ncbi:MAG: bifunctional diaminohydroxyphosphoribosylaminopyrimidine deaminase/5-amino-6-(5-phosphoribosylamino)uracil reductase RibD, partial [Muribaculaceae bacterium]|nr:bifunctional diaminohydroxyphosphoribosylaminopyrimidine deaminase/5-amino-6-(5-phosphoribosylamino)uracil reductase RibD [Muribaculaceae bacterium]